MDELGCLAEDWRTAVGDAVAQLALVDQAALAAHLRAAVERGALLAHAGELVLAWAIGRGDPQALRRFDRELTPEIDAAARRIDRDPAFVDEVRQLVRVRLLVADGDAPARITGYRGRGPLGAWIAVAALRVALNCKRAARPAPAGADVLADVVDREPDPELRHLVTLYRAEFRAALDAAIGALADRERTVLRLRFVDGLSLAEIGRLYRVHESTVSRWVSHATAAVAAGARRRLVEQLAIGASSADSIARLVASKLDLSIARLLR